MGTWIWEYSMEMEARSHETEVRRQNDCPTRNYTGSCDTEAITLITGFAGAGEAGGSVPVRFSGRGVSRVRARAAGLPAGLGSAGVWGAQPRDREAQIGGSHTGTAAVGA